MKDKNPENKGKIYNLKFQVPWEAWKEAWKVFFKSISDDDIQYLISNAPKIVLVFFSENIQDEDYEFLKRKHAEGNKGIWDKIPQKELERVIKNTLAKISIEQWQNKFRNISESNIVRILNILHKDSQYHLLRKFSQKAVNIIFSNAPKEELIKYFNSIPEDMLKREYGTIPEDTKFFKLIRSIYSGRKLEDEEKIVYELREPLKI